MKAIRRIAKPANQIRVIGGSHRSCRIYFPNIEGLRPSTAIVREKVFNWLGQNIYHKKVLDLFSGSGAFAFEAASRGAYYVLAVEKNRQAHAAIVRNCHRLGLLQVEVRNSDACIYLQDASSKFDIIFLDPPYSWQQWDTLLSLLPKCLEKEGIVYIESNRQLIFPTIWKICKRARHGVSYIFLISLPR